MVLLRQHRRGQRQTLREIRAIARDARVDRLERESLPRRQLDSRIAPENHQPGFVFLRLLLTDCMIQSQSLIAHFLAHRIRDIERIDDRERVRFSNRTRLSQERNEERHDGQAGQQRHQGASASYAGSPSLVHPPEPRRQERKPEGCRTGEPNDPAHLKGHDNPAKDRKKEDERHYRTPSHRLARHRHDLAEEAIGEREKIHAVTGYCRTQTRCGKQCNDSAPASSPPRFRIRLPHDSRPDAAMGVNRLRKIGGGKASRGAGRL